MPPAARNPIPDGLPTGEAVATTAGRLPARWVIHTVGPTYATTKDKSHLLAACFRNSLAVADELGAATVAFPAISTGSTAGRSRTRPGSQSRPYAQPRPRYARSRSCCSAEAAYDAFASQGSDRGTA